MKTTTWKGKRVMGLKLGRIEEWWEVVKAESEGYRVMERVRMVMRMVMELRKGVVGREEWRRRMKICGKCVIYDGRLRRCRRGRYGCGCWVVGKGMVKGKCWGKESGIIDPRDGKEVGW